MMGEQPKSPVLLALYRGIIAFDQWVEVENETERGVAAKCTEDASRIAGQPANLAWPGAEACCHGRTREIPRISARIVLSFVKRFDDHTVNLR